MTFPNTVEQNAESLMKIIRNVRVCLKVTDERDNVRANEMKSKF